MTNHEIVELLGGLSAVARMLDISPASVHAWLKRDVIPPGQLIQLAARIERLSGGRFDRREQWPDTYHLIWPELARPEQEQAQTVEV